MSDNFVVSRKRVRSDDSVDGQQTKFFVDQKIFERASESRMNEIHGCGPSFMSINNGFI